MAWIIVRNQDTPVYFGDNGEGEFDWVTDLDSVIYLARKKDAERLISCEGLVDCNTEEVDFTHTTPHHIINDKCIHPKFSVKANVVRLLDSATPILPNGGTRFSIDLTVMCSACKQPFRFLGIETGLSPSHPRVSIDALQLRAPIEPNDVRRSTILVESSYKR